MTGYGYANGWSVTPAPVQACRDLGHVLNEKTVGRCVHEYSCPICGISYLEDSSD